MPVYDYRCTSCDAREEHILLAGESPPAECKACGAPLKRTYGGARVHVALEGWGFSRNDGLVSGDTSRKDWKELKRRADRLRDE
jgi:putative FmdB family regulatory protein